MKDKVLIHYESLRYAYSKMLKQKQTTMKNVSPYVKLETNYYLEIGFQTWD